MDSVGVLDVLFAPLYQLSEGSPFGEEFDYPHFLYSRYIVFFQKSPCGDLDV